MFYGKYIKQRKELDYTFHKIFSKERQLLQDNIIDRFLNKLDCKSCILGNGLKPLLIFTAGAMGAGKSHTLKKMLGNDYNNFVIADVDRIKHCLPEMTDVLKEDPYNAGHLLHSESCTIHEILMRKSIQEKLNIIVDGSLRNGQFFYDFIHDHKLKNFYEIIIIHVIANLKTCVKRAQLRSVTTKRIVPIASIEISLQQCPKSVELLKPIVDTVITIYND